MKTLIEMAREAGLGEMGRRTGFVFFQPGTDGLERFAELVRADEREACAKVAENMDDMVLALLNVTRQPVAIAAAIRARGEST